MALQSSIFNQLLFYVFLEFETNYYFCSGLMKEVDSTIFEGPETRRLFLHSVPKLEQKIFYNAGIFVAWSVLHGGPGIPVLNESVYRLLVGQNVNYFNLEDVDCDVQDRVKMVQTHISIIVRP